MIYFKLYIVYLLSDNLISLLLECTKNIKVNKWKIEMIPVFYGELSLYCVTFIQVPNDCLLLQEVIAQLLTEPKGQHVMCECPGNKQNTKLNSVQWEIKAI